MDSATSPPPDQTTTTTHPLGVGEPLPVVDLPEPEEVFGVPHLGRKEVVRFVLGPSLIALGISIGSGEWLLGPLNVGTLGFVGVGWIITVSALLQVFYNLEISRYVLATGEVPIVGFGRIPPGRLALDPVLADRAVLRLHLGRLGQSGRPGAVRAALRRGPDGRGHDHGDAAGHPAAASGDGHHHGLAQDHPRPGAGQPRPPSPSSSSSCWPSICSSSPSASGGTGCAGWSPRPCRPRAATPPCSAAWPGSPPWRRG